MKNLLVIFVVILFASCQQGNENLKSSENEISTAMDNPCIQCTQRIQTQLASCLQSAGSDHAKIEACKAQAARDWTAQCSAICKPAASNTNAIEIEIGQIKQAEKTTSPNDKDIKMVASIDGAVNIKEACSGSGHIRTVTINGVCYASMCCGGQWMYFYKDIGGKRVWCTCSLGESWTVNCDGNNWIIGCR